MKVAIPKGVKLPPICILTGTQKQVRLREVILPRAWTMAAGTAAVAVGEGLGGFAAHEGRRTRTLYLPMSEDAWERHQRWRVANVLLLFAAFLTSTLGAFGALGFWLEDLPAHHPVTGSLDGRLIMAALAALCVVAFAVFRLLTRHLSPRLLLESPKGVLLDIPSRTAGDVIRDTVDAFLERTGQRRGRRRKRG